MIEARTNARNTHRYCCDKCGYVGLWLKGHDQADHDGQLHRIYVHKETR